jgi:hypothetical protein
VIGSEDNECDTLIESHKEPLTNCLFKTEIGFANGFVMRESQH